MPNLSPAGLLDGEHLAQLAPTILDALPSHVAVVNRDGGIVFVNRAWRSFASGNGYAGESFWVGHSYLDTCRAACGDCSDEAGLVASSLRDVLDGLLQHFELEYPCHSPAEERWFRMMITPVETGAWRGAVVMHVNITERVRAEQALRDSQQRTQVILDSTVDAILTVDAAHRVVSLNAAAERLFGYSASELVGQSVEPLLAPDWRRQGQIVEGTGRRKDGTRFPLDVAVTEVPVAGRRLAILTMRDITARKALDAQRLAEVRGLETLSAPAVRASQGSLERTHPEVFRSLVASYGVAVDHALERRAYRISHDVSAELALLGRQLLALRAGPRDVVALHVRALADRSRSAPAARAQAYLEEGRLLVLELMGNLASGYREELPKEEPTLA